MRNRSQITSRDESAFINGGTAGVEVLKEQSKPEPRIVSKAKPVSISFADEHLNAIDEVIRGEMVSGTPRVNRSDVVRAAVMGLSKLSKSEISDLIKQAKLK